MPSSLCVVSGKDFSVGDISVGVVFRSGGAVTLLSSSSSTMMSGVVEESDDMMYCAACGTAGIDEIKLKDCSACKLVKYCNVQCQKDHRPQHKRACKKRAAELRDEILFKQPESTHRGDCPICCLPLQYDSVKSTMMSCCCKQICNGCEYANRMREFEGKLKHTCPFCRHPLPNLRKK